MPVGLNNYGNTCYMDSALQLIVNSRFIRECIKKQSGYFARALQEIIRSKTTMTPVAIKQLMGRFHTRFAGFAQQDSHEFISLCLDHLENEEQQKQKTYELIEYDSLSPEQGFYKFKAYCERIYDTSYQQALRFYKILVTFCPKCGQRVSFSFHEEESLVLNIRDATGDGANGRPPFRAYPSFSTFYCDQDFQNDYQKLDLQHLLNHYFKEQELDYICSRCRENLYCKPYLWTAPKQLLIVFSRFNNSWQKVNNVVNYVQRLDISQYFHEESPYNELACYDLNAVSLHSGSCGGGHYTAYVVDENGQQWDCNDSWVRRCEVDYADQRAYVLSYSVVFPSGGRKENTLACAEHSTDV